MAESLISLAVIALIAALCPLIAQFIPGKPIPESVLLLVAGALLGPHIAGVIQVDESITLVSELGLAFLFLLAGFEIDPQELTSREGKRGLGTWIITFIIALVIVFSLLGSRVSTHGMIAMTILLTTTALGTLLPILQDRELLDTEVGKLVIQYGTWGEVGPVLAMTVLLSARAHWQTAVILLGLVIICVGAARAGAKSIERGNRVYQFLEEKADSTAQPIMRFCVLLLITLVAFSALFDLDIVLGAFAAGFVLRYILPQGSERLETKINGLAYGFLIPVFFVVSGTTIDLLAVTAMPGLLVLFILALLVIRAVPIYIALSTPFSDERLTPSNRLSVAFYCTTALPLIVAVTSVAVHAGIMETDIASVLVAAGALTVFIMPLLASIAYRVADAEPVQAFRELRLDNHPSAREILHDHLARERKLAQQRHKEEVERARRRHEEFLRRQEQWLSERTSSFEQQMRESSHSQQGQMEALRAQRAARSTARQKRRAALRATLNKQRKNDDNS